MDFDTTHLRNALVSAFGMDEEDANHVTNVVSECFFGENEVNDEDLDKETRSLFYSLEAEGLMTFRRTEYKFEGAIRRAFFWRLTPEVLEGTVDVAASRAQPSEEDRVAALYATLHEDAWNRDAIHA